METCFTLPLTEIATVATELRIPYTTKIPRFNTTFMKYHLNQSEWFHQHPTLVTIQHPNCSGQPSWMMLPPSHRQSTWLPEVVCIGGWAWRATFGGLWDVLFCLPSCAVCEYAVGVAVAWRRTMGLTEASSLPSVTQKISVTSSVSHPSVAEGALGWREI